MTNTMARTNYATGTYYVTRQDGETVRVTVPTKTAARWLFDHMHALGFTSVEYITD